jgi:hypothetical protein
MPNRAARETENAIFFSRQFAVAAEDPSDLSKAVIRKRAFDSTAIESGRGSMGPDRPAGAPGDEARRNSGLAGTQK